MMDSPFPVKGTVEATEHGYSANLPCESMWLTETENGDLLQQAVDRVAREYGEEVKVEVRWTGRDGIAKKFEVLGPVEEAA